MGYYNLQNDDIYAGDVDPVNNINPKRLGALYINYASGEMFTCIDNTNNANRWSYCVIQDKWKSLGTVSGNFNLNFNGSNNNFNNFWIALGGVTNFTSVITGPGCKERSGLLVITAGGTLLNRMFANAFFSFTVPILSPPNASANGNFLVFPYKILPTGGVIITRC